MGTYEFKLPDLAEGTTEGEIATWYVTVGARIEEEQPLVGVMTDKDHRYPIARHRHCGVIARCRRR